MKQLEGLDRNTLVEMLKDAARNWLAHDGLWFLAAEKHHGIEHAIELDREAWEKFTVVEAERIMKRHGIEPGGGIPALAKALQYRLYAYMNEQETTNVTENTLTFTMRTCRVQDARKRKGLPDFPCKPVGLVEYGNFAKTIDPRIQTRCITCPPERTDDTCWCSWEFTIPAE
jgi:hypothetical protein